MVNSGVFSAYAFTLPSQFINIPIVLLSRLKHLIRIDSESSEKVMKSKRLCVLALSFAVGVFVAGCENTKKKDSGNGSASLQGEIKVEGSSTVEPIALVAKDKFRKKYPKVRISVVGNGSSNGFKALYGKECDFSDASRPIKATEVEKCKSAGVEFVEVPVAYDGLTIVVNPKNEFVKQLTVDQLKKIFRKDQAVTTWKKVNPEWPDKQIDIFAPGTSSGTHEYFMEVIDKKKESGMRANDGQTQLSEDDKILVDGVKNNEFAIGFFGFSYYDANKESLRVVPIVNKEGKPITPSIKTIESGEYAPFSRPLFIYVNKASYDKNQVREFIDFFLENIQDIVKEAAYVPLPKEVYAAAVTHLEEGLTGTHYVDAEGKKRSGSVIDIYKKENLLKK